MTPPVLLASRHEKGLSLAWTAVLFAFVLVPLMVLTLDGTRLFYVRSHLQTATDAACEDAAWSGADIVTYQQTGVTQFRTDWYPLAVAQATFANVTADAGLVRYNPVVHVILDTPSLSAQCSAMAGVPLLVGTGTVTVTAASVSSLRFGHR